MNYLKSFLMTIVALWTVQTNAANVYWTNTTDGALINWGSTGVWLGATGPNNSPLGTDTVLFTNQNLYTVNFNSGITTNAAATFNAGNTAGGATTYLNIGANNTWLITNGNFTISGTVAAESNNLNNVILTSGTLINTNAVNQFSIGLNAKGALTVSNSATVIAGKVRIGNAAAGQRLDQRLVEHPAGVDRDHRVQERPLFGSAHRIGLVHPRDGDHGDAGNRPQSVQRALQVRGTIAEVGAEPEVGPHHRTGAGPTGARVVAHRSMRTATWPIAPAMGGSILRTSTVAAVTRGSMRHAAAMRSASRSMSRNDSSATIARTVSAIAP